MWMPSKNAKRVTDGTMHSVLNLFIYLYLFIRSYLQTWGDHSMRSIVLPWYPGGHVLSKMQGRHFYLQDRHGEGSQKKKHKAKNHEDCNPIKECRKKNRHRRRNKRTKKTSPAHPCHLPLPDSKTEMPVPTI